MRAGSLITIAAIAATAGCASQGDTSTAGTPPQNAPAPATAAAAMHKAVPRKPGQRSADAISACYAQAAASGDIYVRDVDPGIAAQAEELGGGWSWNYRTGTCQTSVQWAISAAPQAPGHCTQVGDVSDNSGYDADATPAKPLENVAAESGPAC